MVSKKNIWKNIITIILIYIVFCSISYSESLALVSKPVNKMPGVNLPTPDPAIPTRVPVPTKNKDEKPVTPLYMIGNPTPNPSPIFVEIKDGTTSVTSNKGNSSTGKLVFLLVAVVVFIGAMTLFYKSQMKG
ncbi:MAG TPA: hypothetical protein PL110_01030 [Candidatus Eremiobacteraeota bacterium]|nr:MAG: hypothetical protein BWY64_03328 [bacterium ADurb.Bin363]HPZ06669.1 hypothetical protein [Candidatus Eremiobacteraeota bacterium]